MQSDSLHNIAGQIRQSPFGFFIRNGHMAILVLFTCVLGGFFALSQMPVESDPEVKIPIGIVTVSYPGASPADIEKLVTDEIETALQDLDDVKEITSNSQQGIASLTVEFEASADLKESIRNLRDEVDQAKSELPEEANDPIVTEVRAGDRAIITFTVTGTEPPAVMKEYVDALEEELERINGVSKVEVDGLPDREWQVLVNRQKLEGYGLSINAVTQAISRNHVDIPVGAIETDGYYYQTSLKAQFQNPEELESAVIAALATGNIYLRDVAIVRESFAETSSETTLYETASDTSESAVALGLYKKTGEDLIAIIDDAKAVVADFTANDLPETMNIIVTDDESDRINEDISNLLRSALQTVIIIAITLFLALGAREALAAALSIPILYLISFVWLWMIGETFNFLTFFALILSLGVVVDTSIVVIEGVYENMQKHKMAASDAALASIGIFRAPLIAGTMTTLAAFLPLGLMTGIMGEYVKHIPYTVNITLVASLFTALLLLPSVAVWLLGHVHHPIFQRPPLMKPYFERLSDWYSGHIHRILHSRRRRTAWVAGMVGAFFFSFFLLGTGIVKFQLFSAVDVNLFFVNINAPEGTVLNDTRLITQQVEERLKQIPELKRYVSVYGSGAPHQGRITVTLTDPDERKRKSYEITTALRRELRRITEAEVLLEELSAGPPSGADIQVRLVGDDIRQLEEFSAEVQAELRTIPGAIDVTNDLELSPGEYHLKPKRDRLEYFGVDAGTIGQLLRTTVFGNDGATITRAGEETDIVVRADYRNIDCTSQPVNQLLEARDEITICRSNPDDIAELLNILIVTSKGQVPLSELVSVELVSAVTVIRHFDRDRVVSVRANVEDGYVLSDVLTKLESRTDQMDKPDGVSVQYGGENEDTLESVQSLFRASALALLLIFVILVYQFASFRQVFIVFSTMAMAFMGVIYGLALIRVPLSFPGMIGLVALFGIVVNDAIVLIDKFNTNRQHDYQDDLIGAVEAGVKQRLEPVIMTTATTALGVLPLIFTGETFRDLAIVVAVGITVATIFTLVMIPILYIKFEQGDLKPWRWPWLLIKMLWQAQRKIWLRVATLLPNR